MAVQDHGAFIEKFILQQSSPSDPLPLTGLTFAVKDIFDMEGYVTGFGNPEWLRTHPPANQTAPAVLAILRGGATCIGKTIMDEMAFSISGENFHYGTPRNPYASDRIPGGSSSGSAVAVGAKLVDFSLGKFLVPRRTDTGGSVRVPASYCGILGFRPSHGVVSTSGVIPMTQSFDTVGWFAIDSAVFKRVGRLLLQEPEVEHYKPTQVLIAEDCFKLSSIPSERLTQAFVNSVKKLFGDHLIKQISIGSYVEDKVPSLKHFMIEENDGYKHIIPSLAALVRSKVLLQRHEFKINHGEWVRSYSSHLGPGKSERISEYIRVATDENTDLSRSVQIELRVALAALLEATIPLGLYNGLPVSISLLAKHGSDGFLLNVVDTLYSTLKQEVEASY
ncbi:Amidase 1 [Cucurbita argyrosperma subsp. argyrosperma]|nr:Amidase 1 [Cucurbita argyrosperma subsp. argyrosperma]